MSETTLGLERRRQIVTQPGAKPIENYRIDVASTPVNRWLEIQGPGYGIRFLRHGSHSFESFSELAKTLVQPEMSDLEKAMAVYRFSARNFHGFTMGWGNTEMTRFISGFGYSYCWGQGDFQHLLYEACGLKTRSPWVKGHSTPEVLIDGKWRLLDAFMRVVLPSAELDGLATGEEMHEQPERWAHYREPSTAASGRDYWSKHAPGGTYEPWQDSRAMMLTLRRGEALRWSYDPGTQACMAAFEPDDFLNGRWTWSPTLDEQHLQREVEAHENLKAGDGGLQAIDGARPALVEYRIQSPWPLITGTLGLEVGAPSNAKVTISNDNRRTWRDLGTVSNQNTELKLDEHLSSRHIPPSVDVASAPHRPRYEVIVRIAWTGPAVLRGVRFDFLIQAHRPSVPCIDSGVNQWRFIGGEAGSSITHTWDEYPGLRISNDRPCEGEQVTIEADVHNRGNSVAENVRVRIIDETTDASIGEAVIPRIEAGSSATAKIDWLAAIQCVKRKDQPGLIRPYVRSRLRVVVGAPQTNDAGSSDASLVTAATATIVVRPSPRPLFHDSLIWSSDARESDRELVVLRATVIHLQATDETPALYLIDSELNVTLTPYLGHPDRGGLRLAAPKRLCGIQPSEFAVAQWDLSVHGLPDEFDVWIEAKCAAPVAQGSERILAQRRVRLKH